MIESSHSEWHQFEESGTLGHGPDRSMPTDGQDLNHYRKRKLYKIDRYFNNESGLKNVFGKFNTKTLIEPDKKREHKRHDNIRFPTDDEIYKALFP